MASQKQGGIEWCDRTVNVVTGCTPIVEPGHPSACERCYAQRMAQRLKGRAGYPADDPFRVTLRPERLPELLRAKPGERVFVPSMGDLFHDEVPNEYIAAVFGCFAARPEATFIVLTKRPERARRWFEWAARDSESSVDPEWYIIEGLAEAVCEIGADHDVDIGEMLPIPVSVEGWPLPNVWLLATCESQYWLERRIEDLLACPAAVHGISVEGMLGPIELPEVLMSPGHEKAHYLHSAGCGGWCDFGCGGKWLPERLDWVICGAEQGQRARPFDRRWARSLLEQCRSAGVPFFFKKLPNGEMPPADLLVREWPDAR